MRDCRERCKLHWRHVETDAVGEQAHGDLLQSADEVARHVMDDEIACAEVRVADAACARRAVFRV